MDILDFIQRQNSKTWPAQEVRVLFGEKYTT